MAKVEIYTTRTCPYCTQAKQLLDQKQVHYVEYHADDKPELREEMQERGGGHTVPQIFIDNQPIGGCDDLYALEQAGKLGNLLE